MIAVTRSVACQHLHPGGRRRAVQPGCSRSLALGDLAVPPAGPSPGRVEISETIPALLCYLLLPKLPCRRPLGWREGSAWPKATPRPSGTVRPAGGNDSHAQSYRRELQ